MATNDPKVSGSDESGEGLPTPQFSETAPSSTSTDNADAIVSKLTPILEALIEKKVQSTKDKRFSRLEQALGGRLDMLAELENEGVTIPKDLKSDMRVRDLEERLTQLTTPQPAPVVDAGTSTTRQAVTDAVAELKNHNLDPNDADFIDLLRGNYSNRDAFDNKVARYVLGKVSPHPASPAGVVQSAATGGQPVKGREALKADYVKELQAVRGSKASVKAVQAKFKAQGLDVENIIISV